MFEDSVIKLLIKHFYNNNLKFDILPEDVDKLTWQLQEDFLKATLDSDLLAKYPVNQNYAKLFIKKLIQLLESRQEIHDKLFTHLCALMDTVPGENCFRHYLLNNSLNDIITIKETNKMVVNGTTGMKTWEASFVLCDWALNNKEIFENKNVLELGSGVGFSGITLAKYCNLNTMTMTDYHEDVLRTIKENIDINFPQSETEESPSILYRIRSNNKSIGSTVLDWTDTQNIAKNLIPDIIIGADIVYDPTLLQPLIDVISIFFNKNRQLQVYIAGVVRNEETYKKFKELIGSIFLSSEILHKNTSCSNWINDTSTMYLLSIYNKH